MTLLELSPGITRIRILSGESPSASPVLFSDEHGEYLRQTGCVFSPRPVWRLSGSENGGEVKQTANGEVVSFDSGTREQIRTSHSARIAFECPEPVILTGLGTHEDGIFDYSRETEMLYEHNMKIPIPFLLGSSGWGLLLEAGCAMKFRGEGRSFCFELDAADEVSYLVLRGSDCADVLRKLSSCVGLPAMLPKWAFGYIQSRERYQSSDELLAVSREFRRRRLGLDCIVQDWMTWKDGCWGDKTPDPARFPDVRALTDTLHQMNVRLMVSVWPNTGKGRDCDEFAAVRQFLPSSRIYNAFSPEARDLYWQQCRRFWMDGGTDALWCDSDEPITDPDWCGEEKRDPETRYRLITEASSLRMDPETMNHYASRHLHGLREHWLRDFPDKRPVLLSRSGGPDSASLGVILWSGDICARWDVLSKQVTEAVRSGLSGLVWWTLDIGGFFVGQKEQWFWRGDYPEGVADPGYRELYLRWFQFGSMLPVFRSHGTDTPREPWFFGGEDSPEYMVLRDTIRLRYKLLPYLYSCAAECCRNGLPMVRAMLVSFPEDPAAVSLADQYMLGDALLVKPVTRPLKEGGASTPVVLPEGLWYDLLTKEAIPGGGTVILETPLERFPLLVRAGSILPLSGEACCSAEVSSPAAELLIFGGADGSFTLYDDAGDGMGYLKGEYLRIPLRWDDQSATLHFGDREGSLPVDVSLSVRLIRPDGNVAVRTVRYQGKALSIAFHDF